MSSIKDKIYVGNGKTKTTQYGDLLSVTLDLDTLVREFDNHGFLSGKGEKKIKVTILKKKEIGEYGDTHYLTLDTWHPSSYVPPGLGKPVFETPDIKDGEDIPF